MPLHLPYLAGARALVTLFAPLLRALDHQAKSA